MTSRSSKKAKRRLMAALRRSRKTQSTGANQQSQQTETKSEQSTKLQTYSDKWQPKLSAGRVTTTVKVSPLRFTPYAWAKLLWMRDYKDIEVSFMGISSEKDLLLIEDLGVIKQWGSKAFTEFCTDDLIGRFYFEQSDLGRNLERVNRIWIHTHPEMSAQPSGHDEQTFKSVWSGPDIVDANNEFWRSWGIMCIVSKTEDKYARLHGKIGYNPSIVVDMELPIQTDWTAPFSKGDHDAWREEYEKYITVGGRHTTKTYFPNNAQNTYYNSERGHYSYPYTKPTSLPPYQPGANPYRTPMPYEEKTHTAETLDERYKESLDEYYDSLAEEFADYDTLYGEHDGRWRLRQAELLREHAEEKAREERLRLTPKAPSVADAEEAQQTQQAEQSMTVVDAAVVQATEDALYNEGVVDVDMSLNGHLNGDIV